MKSMNKQPSIQAVYVWNVVGSMANALLSVVVLMIVTRSLDNREADIFSVAWTISQLMATIGTFQIRVYQATDVRGEFDFRQYLLFRIITIAVMFVVSILYVWNRGYYGYKALIILIICVFRGIDALADIFEGWFQQKERLDLAGKALTYRVVVAVMSAFIGLYFKHDLLVTSIVLVMSYGLCFFAFDVRYYLSVDVLKHKIQSKNKKNWVGKLFKEGFPLFFNAFIMMSINNTPKMMIDTAIEQGVMGQGIQTIYNILFMPASVLTLAYIVFRPLITKMAIVWERKKGQEFLKILFKIIIVLVVFAIVLILGSTLLGIPVLSYLYAIDLKSYQKHLIALILGGCFYTFSAVLDNALTVIRKQYILIAGYAITWIYVKVISSIFVIKWGLMGAVMIYTTGMAVFLLCAIGIFAGCFRNACKSIKN